MAGLTETTLLRIGQLKDRTQIPVKTIRYYETLGLIEAETRTEGGFRLFSPAIEHRLDFIKRAQRLGLSLQEIGEILQIRDRDEQPCQVVKQKLQAKIQAIDEQLRQLSLLKAQLSELMTAQGDRPLEQGVICPVIEKTAFKGPGRSS
jgi:MerR family transcriptional regulator, copper efflux regulator